MAYVEKFEVPPPPPDGLEESDPERYHRMTVDRECYLEFNNPGDVCFYCGLGLTCEDLVMWAGHSDSRPGVKEIWLHAPCAARIGEHLIRDASESTETRVG